MAVEHKKVLFVRVRRKLHQQLAINAIRNGNTLASYCETLLSKAINGNIRD